MNPRPLIVNLPPQAWQAERLARTPGDGPDPFWIEREFDEAGFDFETLDPLAKPWNPGGGKHGAYQGIDPLRALKVLLTKRKAALVLTGSESPALVLGALRKALGYRPPVAIWELSWSPGWEFRNWLCRRTVPRVDRTIVVGTNQLELVRRDYGETARPAFIPVYTDIDFFSPQQPRRERPAPYVVSVGRDRGRDFDLLIEATAGLGRALKIKTGRYPVPVDTARVLHVEVIDRYLSYRDLRTLYAEADVVGITTHDTPNACGVTSLMEAMAMGKAVVVSNNPALADYLPPPGSGAAVIVPIGDRAALRSAIADLLANPRKAADMGRRARAYAVERFHPRPNLKILTDLCWSIIEEAGTAKRPRQEMHVPARRAYR